MGGLLQLHMHAIIHGDLKEANIMLRVDDLRQPDVVLIDFGLAPEFLYDKETMRGTPGYIPPETWRSHKWAPRGDCFSMGVTMFQLLSGCPRAFAGIFPRVPYAYEEIAKATIS